MHHVELGLDVRRKRHLKHELRDKHNLWMGQAHHVKYRTSVTRGGNLRRENLKLRSPAPRIDDSEHSCYQTKMRYAASSRTAQTPDPPRRIMDMIS